jgi:Xaa-Pro dipeptidase
MNDQLDKSLYRDHLAVLSRRWGQSLTNHELEAAVILAGAPSEYFLDDQAAPFRPNPHFVQWFPQHDCARSALIIRPGEQAELLFYSPDDYWHQSAALPEWADAFTIRSLDSESLVADAIAEQLRRVPATAVVGECDAGNLGGNQNPQGLLNELHYHRAWKTEFELDAMRQASNRAAAGHLAAARCFRDGGSEFDIHLGYLAAAQHTPEELPYSSIVALNEHAGVLHYQHYDRHRPRQTSSFLIDAGASSLGYAADVTRTYASDAGGQFASLVAAVDDAQQDLIAGIRPGQRYLDLHADMHERIAAILGSNQLINCSPEAAMTGGITRAFFPHGLGHLIGLQTHDVAGQQIDDKGTLQTPPEEYPALRLTRELSAGMVFTIEPGIYFIPMLLEALRNGDQRSDINWSLVDSLMGCGGIRIEDNVVVTDSEPENLTRAAFARIKED